MNPELRFSAPHSFATPHFANLWPSLSSISASRLHPAEGEGTSRSRMVGRWGPSARAQGQGWWEHPWELLSQLEMQHRDPHSLGNTEMKDTGEANQKSAGFFFHLHSFRRHPFYWGQHQFGACCLILGRTHSPG